MLQKKFLLSFAVMFEALQRRLSPYSGYNDGL